MSDAVNAAPQANGTLLHFDEPAFLKKIPYPLHRTALAGVYSVPAPPAALNLTTASQSDLLKSGILFRRPTPDDPPYVHAAWNAYLAQKWDPAKRIVPVSVPQPGVTHTRRTQLKPSVIDNDNILDADWAGAATRTGKWTSLAATWTVPTVSKPSEPQGTQGGWSSSCWIGLDGDNDTNDVLQAGIQHSVNAAGQASYVAWYEWFAPVVQGSPTYVHQTNIPNFAVAPGNVISCTIQYVGTTGGYISIGNQTTGANFAITLAPPPGANFSGSSCEWILEAPNGEPTDAIPRFTPITFNQALACGPNGATANPGSGDTLNIRSATGKVLTSTTVGSDTTTISFIG